MLCTSELCIIRSLRALRSTNTGTRARWSAMRYKVGYNGNL